MAKANLYDFLAAGFPADRGAPCFLLEDGGAIAYGALEAGAGAMAGHLRRRGVAAGDRILTQTAKSPEAVMLYLAALKIGAVIAPLNTAYTQSEIEYFIADCEPAMVVRDAIAFAREAADAPPVMESAACEPDDVAALVYTSGTTGRSKGAMLTHGALCANARALNQAWGFTRSDTLIHALPIFHVHGLFVALHCALANGAPMLWFAKFDDTAILAAMPRATIMMGVPTFYTRLLANPHFTQEAARGMRVFISGSAPLLPSTFEEFEARTGMRILERYGMSEAAIITTNPLEGPRLAGAVGFPLPGVALRIAGGEETGTIEIKGPSVFSGYWRNPEKTAESFTADGYFITGDVGRLDDEGRLWISGRAKDLIISGGYNVYPKEIELVLDEMEGVAESAVIGAPHPDFGEAVVAVVQGAGDEGAMIAAARARLAAFKAPKRIFFVDELPRNAMGKVQKNLLRDAYAETFKTAPTGDP
ncbi:MAG: AMP-binding protein [Hyphomonadaceae bacterium]